MSYILSLFCYKKNHKRHVLVLNNSKQTYSHVSSTFSHLLIYDVTLNSKLSEQSVRNCRFIL
jgi:hypothetical protein